MRESKKSAEVVVAKIAYENRQERRTEEPNQKKLEGELKKTEESLETPGVVTSTATRATKESRSGESRGRRSYGSEKKMGES